MKQAQIIKVLAKSAIFSSLVIASTNANALKINANFSSDMTWAQKSAFTYAAAQFENTFTNNVTVVMDICSNVNTGAICSTTNASSVGLGASLSYLRIYDLTANNYNGIAGLLKNSDPALSLPSFNQLTAANSTSALTKLALTLADATVLGLVMPTVTYNNPDGIIYFNSSQNYATSVNSPVPANGYNLISVFEHEISEVLGKISTVPSGYISPIDLLRYTAPGQLTLAKDTTTPIYLSTDLGNSQLVSLNTHYLSGDLGDFINTTDAFNYVAYQGVHYSTTLSNVDISTMQALGYTVATPVPEPETYQMLTLGLLGLAYRVRKPKSAR